MQIRNSTALVTGANRGIGRQLVVALLEAGARRVYAAARDPTTLTGIIAADRERIVPVRLDVTDPEQVASAAGVAADVTLLINNAGILEIGSVLDAPLDSFDRLFATNFTGKLRMARAFAPIIESNGGGAIANIVTVLAMASMPGFGVYNASKAALWSLTLSLRASLAARNIDVVGVFPAGVDTDMLAGVDAAKADPLAVARAIIAGIEQGLEDIYPDDVSAAVYEMWRKDHKAVEKQFAAM